jgi:hypothetical protein
MDFRKDINGLRAIAVVAVVLFHFGISSMKGGFVGVDIFFVISGFLMTGIIFNKVGRGDFSLIGFYLDRGRRIIPALAFLCFVLLVAGWYLLAPSQYRMLGKHVGGSLLSISINRNLTDHIAEVIKFPSLSPKFKNFEANSGCNTFFTRGFALVMPNRAQLPCACPLKLVPQSSRRA